MGIYRHDMAIWTYGPNQGITTSGSNTLITRGVDNDDVKFVAGAYESVTLPDPISEWNPRYFLNQHNDRNWTAMYRGRETLQGSASNIILLSGVPLVYLLGSVSHSGGTAARTLVTTALDGAHSSGDDTIEVDNVTGIIAGDTITIGGESATVSSVAGNTITLSSGLAADKADNAVVTRAAIAAGGTSTHVIYEAPTPTYMDWDLQLRDSGNNTTVPDSNNDFVRRYLGGVVNRGTISADEGGLLMMSWDDVIFLDMVHNQANSDSISGISRYHDFSSTVKSASSIGPSGSDAIFYPETDPYYFSQGVVSFFGIPFARVRNFRLEINNNIEPRYYIEDRGGGRGPTEFQAQNRELTLSVTMAMANTIAATNTERTLWKEFILQGNYEVTNSPAKLQGFEVSLTFEKGTGDSITMVSPYIGSSSVTSSTNTLSTLRNSPGTAFGTNGCFFRRVSHNLGTESPIQVDGEVVMRNVVMIVNDNIAEANYPTPINL